MQSSLLSSIGREETKSKFGVGFAMSDKKNELNEKQLKQISGGDDHNTVIEISSYCPKPECNTFIDSWTFLGSILNTAEKSGLYSEILLYEVCCSKCGWKGCVLNSNYDVHGYFS